MTRKNKHDEPQAVDDELPAADLPAADPEPAPDQPAGAAAPAYTAGTMYDVELSGSLHWRQRRYQPGDKLRLDGDVLNQPEVAAVVRSATERRGERPRVPRKSLGEM